MANEPFHDVALGGSFWQEEGKRRPRRKARAKIKSLSSILEFGARRVCDSDAIN